MTDQESLREWARKPEITAAEKTCQHNKHMLLTEILEGKL